jgi:hypothetical protein
MDPGSSHEHVGLVGTSPTGATSNGQPVVDDLEAGSMGEELSALQT